MTGPEKGKAADQRDLSTHHNTHASDFKAQPAAAQVGLKATKHTLQLVAGPLHLTVTESAAEVHFGITGAKPAGFENGKLLRFMQPLIYAYEADPRPVRVGGRGVDYEGHVQAMPGVGAVAWTTPAGGKS